MARVQPFARRGAQAGRSGARGTDDAHSGDVVESIPVRVAGSEGEPPTRWRLIAPALLAFCLLAPLASDASQARLFQTHPQGDELRATLELGMRRLNEGRLEEAIGHFSDVLESVDNEPVTRYLRAVARMRLGAFVEAERDLRTILSADPSLPNPRRDLASAYLRQNKLQEAIETYIEILERKPGDLVARWNLRIASERQGAYPGDLPARYQIALPPESAQTSPVFFTDVASDLGVATLSRARGSAWGDYDGDGDADLITVGIRHPHALYRRERNGTFTDVTESAGLADPRGGWASLFFDYDRDGDLDLFVTRDGWRGSAPSSLYRNNGDGTFADVADAAGIGGPMNSFTAALGDIDNDGWLDLYVANGVAYAQGAPNALYRNRGDGTFMEVAVRAGVANHGRSIGSAFGDYDNDGWTDLFVVNMDGPNALYRNNGNGTFSDVTREAGIAAPIDGFVGFFFDYDNDGWLDLFATGWTQNMEEVLLSALSGRPSQERNRLALYHNDGDGTFSDVTASAGLARTYGAMAAQYGDVDNDGYQDIYLGTGSPLLDTYEPNKLFWNRGNGTFLDVTESAGVGNLGKGHGATFADYDGDGDLDLYAPIGGAIASDMQPNSLYRNDGPPGSWLKVRLIGTRGNVEAVGARVRVTTDLGTVHRVVAGGTGFGSMNDPVMTIGLGGATRINEIEIRWPGGVGQVLAGLAPGQTLEVTEDRREFRQVAPGSASPPASPPPR